jgi:hypothetical protein
MQQWANNTQIHTTEEQEEGEIQYMYVQIETTEENETSGRHVE